MFNWCNTGDFSMARRVPQHLYTKITMSLTMATNLLHKFATTYKRESERKMNKITGVLQSWLCVMLSRGTGPRTHNTFTHAYAHTHTYTHIHKANIFFLVLHEQISTQQCTECCIREFWSYIQLFTSYFYAMTGLSIFIKWQLYPQTFSFTLTKIWLL